MAMTATITAARTSKMIHISVTSLWRLVCFPARVCGHYTFPRRSCKDSVAEERPRGAARFGFCNLRTTARSTEDRPEGLKRHVVSRIEGDVEDHWGEERGSWLPHQQGQHEPDEEIPGQRGEGEVAHRKEKAGEDDGPVGIVLAGEEPGSHAPAEQHPHKRDEKQSPREKAS